MTRVDAPPFQLRANELGLKEIKVFLFEERSVIFTDRYGQVVALQVFYADKIPDVIKGYPGYRIRQPILVGAHSHEWTLHQGALFGVPNNHQGKHQKTFHLS